MKCQKLHNLHSEAESSTTYWKNALEVNLKYTLLFQHQNARQCHAHIAQKMKFSIKDFFSKCDQIRRKLRFWSHLLKKTLMENFIFCAVIILRLVNKCLENLYISSSNKPVIISDASTVASLSNKTIFLVSSKVKFCSEKKWR